MRFIYIGVISLLFGTSIFAQSEWQNFEKDIKYISNSEMNSRGKIVGYRATPLNSNYDIKYHRLNWNIDPSETYISGSVVTYFVPTESDIEFIEFDLASNMIVDSIVFEGGQLEFDLQANDILHITLPSSLNIENEYEIEVFYRGEPANTGFASFSSSYTDDGNPVVSTLSEPYGAKQWWPCKQDLNDKIDSIDVFVTCDAQYRAASNGVLTEEIEVGNGKKVYHWKHRYPIPAYLIAIAVTNYSVYSDWVPVDGQDDIEILNYVFPEDYDYAVDNTPNVIEVMQLYNDLFGIYPFADEKYGHAEFLWGGGMEHQTMSFMLNFGYGLMAHELAHQWFGDMVTCGSWEDLWLNESFATYLTGLTNLYLGSEDLYRNWKSGVINYVTSQPGGSVFVVDTLNLGVLFSSRLTYNKGALVLDMLRWKLGDDDFYEGVRNYLDGRAFDYAHTSDLKFYLEEQSGQDLTEFLADWYYGEGYPTYSITVDNYVGYSTITIDQTTSHSSVDFYEMPVPVKFEGEGQDTILVFDHTFSGEVFVVNLPFEIETAIFDPDLKILSNENSLTVGNPRLENNVSFEINPNPVSDLLNLTFDESIEIKTLRIINMESKKVEKSLSSGFKHIEVSDFPPGMYILEVKTDEFVSTKKFLKI